VPAIHRVQWGDTDVLVVDLPPGTGDAQLTLCQQTPLSGAIIVSTPQEVALADVRKGVNMFKTLSVPVRIASSRERPHAELSPSRLTLSARRACWGRYSASWRT